MMRSLFTGVAGLRTHQMKMDVIGNNIANVNTAGFKAGSVTFKEMFYQSMQGASAPNADTSRGGTNPLQIGLGVSTASIDNVMSQGAAQTTDNPLDMMINGNSFFIVGDGSGKYFTRAGAFRLDVEGNLVNPSGLKVQGWPASSDGTAIAKGQVQDIKIKSAENMSIAPVPTTLAAFEGNLNMAEGTVDPTTKEGGIPKALDFYDTLGNHYTLNCTFTYDPAKEEWSMELAKEMMRNDTDTVKFDVLTHNPVPGIKFDTSGKLIQPLNIKIGPMDTDDLGINAEIPEMEVSFTGMTQYESKTTIKGSHVNGGSAGQMIGFSVGPDGIIVGSYSNGQTKKLGQIAVATFKNPAGLEKIGDNLFTTSSNSGYFDGIGEDPTSGGGSIGGSRLEMSNVDLSKEFTEMITTQRGFQANSRVITTSDEMLQELVRLK